MFRTTIARNARLFGTSARFQKSVVESASDAIHSADKAVSQHVVKGIEVGEQAAEKVKQAVGVGAKEAEIKGKEAQLEAQKLGNQAQNKASEVASEAKKQVNQATRS